MEIIIDGRQPEFATDADHTIEGEKSYKHSLLAKVLGDEFKKDHHFKDIVADSLRAGSVKIDAWHFDLLSSAFTNILAETGEHLGLTDIRGPELVRREIKDKLEKRPDLDSAIYETRLGSNLRNGLLIFRGNLDTITGLGGGSVYVEGDVKKIVHTGSGVVVVNGDVEAIDEAAQTVIMVTGTLGKYHRRNNSPYVFAFKIKEIDDKLSPLVQPVEDNLTFMKGFSPKEATEFALDAARAVNTRYARTVVDLAQKASNPNDLAEFARLQMFASLQKH